MLDLVGNPKDRFSHNEAHICLYLGSNHCDNGDKQVFNHCSVSGKLAYHTVPGHALLKQFTSTMCTFFH